jgi:hypothetical protein
LPVSHATISVYDKTGALVDEATSDEAGEAKLELKEYTYFYDTAARYQYFSPYRIEVKATGLPVATRTVALDRSMELPVALGSAK